MPKDARPKCPLCKDRLTYTPIAKKKDPVLFDSITHIYTCDACPFAGLEYYNDQDLTSFNKYLKS
jgi:hypothetical protein